jgi:cytochrome c oxidase assembly protein subunit 15
LNIVKGHRFLLLAAALATYLLVTMGGVVCVTGAARGCPDWPGCYGQILPPARPDAVIEFTHRFVALLGGLLIVASAVVGMIRYRRLPWVAWPPAIAIVFTIAVAIFGALVVLRGLPPLLAAVDFSSALTVLALMVTATVAAFYASGHPTHSGRLSLRSGLARLALVTLAVVFVVFVSGIFVGGEGSLARCLGWPLYGPGLGGAGSGAWLQTVRLVLGAAAVLLVAAVVLQARRARSAPAAVRAVGTALGALLMMEIVAGVLLMTVGLSVGLLAIYVALAAAVWAVLVALVVLAGLV